jgi:hypothetical protein
VLKPGGQFHCLEFSTVNLPILKEMYDAYSFKVIPTLGRYRTYAGLKPCVMCAHQYSIKRKASFCVTDVLFGGIVCWQVKCILSCPRPIEVHGMEG